jgi:hypothetical protein
LKNQTNRWALASAGNRARLSAVPIPINIFRALAPALAMANAGAKARNSIVLGGTAKAVP